jgi:hypothetical protein
MGVVDRRPSAGALHAALPVNSSCQSTNPITDPGDPAPVSAQTSAASVRSGAPPAERYRLEFVDMDTFRSPEPFRSIPAD